MTRNIVQASPFDQIRHTTEDGREYWSARELAKVLGYSRWQRFQPAIEKAGTACTQSGFAAPDHFTRVGIMVRLGSGAQRETEEWHLSRYACYLVAQNADPSKRIVALAQTYFAEQTHRQELAEAATLAEASEWQRRQECREQVRAHNKQLAATVYRIGVTSHTDFAMFQDAGYQGLYGGLAARGIATRKGLTGARPSILDHMGSTELAANLFRITQTDEKIRREGIRGKERAGRTHHTVGSVIREAIKQLGGTMPENLPTPPERIGSPRRPRQQVSSGTPPKALPAPQRARSHTHRAP